MHILNLDYPIFILCFLSFFIDEHSHHLWYDITGQMRVRWKDSYVKNDAPLNEHWSLSPLNIQFINNFPNEREYIR
jgi:hypothetical protein